MVGYQLVPQDSSPVSPQRVRFVWQRSNAFLMLLTTFSLLLLPVAVLLSFHWARESLPRCRDRDRTGGASGWVSPWKLINRSKQLVYSPCFGKYQCARLQVPMDWNSTSDPDTVALAIIKLPAVVPVTDPRYGGMILVNPGGPGGSGAWKILTDGARLQKIVDSPSDPSNSFVATDKFYDILGFDGRGINNTTPRYECISEPFARQRWTLENQFDDLVGSSDIATKQAWARAMALAATCSGKGAPKLGRFMNTTPTIADIVEIIERHGEWREREVAALIPKTSGLSKSEKEAVVKASAWNKGQEKLQYWGYSYGSVTGTTFAAMQPYRVKRLIVDGICDPKAMYNGLWTTSILDTDLVMNQFFEQCYKAGPKHCSYYSSEGPAKIQAHLESTLQTLNSTPLSVAGSDSHGPDVITYSDVMKVIKETLYTPLKLFPQLSDLLADISSGNGSKFAEFKTRNPAIVCPPRSSSDPHQIEDCPPYDETSLETLVSISCTDGEDISVLSNEDFANYYATLRNQSKWMSDYWVSFTLSCWAWKTRPKWRYEGPISGVPDHPMLWIGNTLDPATPLRNAFDLSAGYPGSVVLQQDSVGHCTYSSPSKCTNEHVRSYFQDGTLPEPGTVCPPDTLPWGI